MDVIPKDDLYVLVINNDLLICYGVGSTPQTLIFPLSYTRFWCATATERQQDDNARAIKFNATPGQEGLSSCRVVGAQNPISFSYILIGV